MAAIICENHDPPLIFTVEDSLKSDCGDDLCPECSQDSALYYLLEDEDIRELARLGGYRLYQSES